jgi:hypothetical protein
VGRRQEDKTVPELVILPAVFEDEQWGSQEGKAHLSRLLMNASTETSD